MPPKPRNGHDDSSKPETPHSTGKHGHKDGLNGTPASAHHHHHHHAVNGGKMRRVASSAGTNLRESMTAAQLPVAAPDAGLTPASAAGGASSASPAVAADGTAQETGAPGATVCSTPILALRYPPFEMYHRQFADDSSLSTAGPMVVL